MGIEENKRMTRIEDSQRRTELEVRELRKALLESAARDDAFARFQTSGEFALPMSASQVALVANTNVGTIHHAKRAGALVGRFPYRTAQYHPDDVRAWLARKVRVQKPVEETTHASV